MDRNTQLDNPSQHDTSQQLLEADGTPPSHVSVPHHGVVPETTPRAPPASHSVDGHVTPPQRNNGSDQGSRDHFPSLHRVHLRNDFPIPQNGSHRPPKTDWMPIEREKVPPRSIAERLQPTLDSALIARDKYASKAKTVGFALNAAIGLQVVLGSLTTGLATAITGKNASISTAILGGLSTVTASYLARARGSNEPELSITRVKDLEQFIRDCEAFMLDSGHIVTNERDLKLHRLRERFEELLGNANGERKLSHPV